MNIAKEESKVEIISNFKLNEKKEKEFSIPNGIKTINYISFQSKKGKLFRYAVLQTKNETISKITSFDTYEDSTGRFFLCFLSFRKNFFGKLQTMFLPVGGKTNLKVVLKEDEREYSNIEIHYIEKYIYNPMEEVPIHIPSQRFKPSDAGPLLSQQHNEWANNSLMCIKGFDPFIRYKNEM